ncbi:MAG: DnaB-like helicase C-terminal domain-containing protein, partial [Clostridium sp.]
MQLKVSDIKKFEKLNHADLPKDETSEIGLIGTLLVHSEFILKSDYIKPNMFYDRCLGSVYYAIQNLYSKGVTDIDTFMLYATINGNKGLKDPFEDSNIPDIVEFLEDCKLVARETIEEYEILANKVVTASYKRESYVKLNILQDKILTSEDDINKINYDMQQQVTDFSKIYICNKEVLTLGEQADKIWEGIVSKRNEGFFGFPSKYNELNNYATYEKTELMMIAAPGKTGKSQLLANEAWDKAIAGVPTTYIDRELSTENHMIRMLSYLTGIDNRNIKKGQTTLKEESLIKEKLEFIKRLPYTHIYKPVSEMPEMYMTIKSLILKHGVEFLVYDYVKGNDGSDGDKEYQKLGKLTDWLKNDIAGSLDLAVLSACQMDDNGTKVADSQKILRNCSTLAFLTRKTKEEMVNDGADGGNMKLRVKANRNGNIMNEDEYINLVL